MVRAREVILRLGGIEALQLLHADLSRDLRPVRLGRLPGGAAGARAAARLVPVQHLQDVVLVARDRRAALDHLGDQALLRGPATAPRSRSCAPASQPERRTSPHSRSERSWRVLLHGGRSRCSSAAEAAGLTPLRKQALAGLRGVDPRAARADRRARRDLPADHQHDHRVSLPRLRARRPAPRSRRSRELEKLELEDEETLHVQPCFSPVWDTALAIEALVGRRVCPPDDPALLKAGALAPRPRGQAGRRLEEGAARRRRAGRLVLRVRQRVLPRHRRHRRGADGALAVRFPGEAEDLARAGRRSRAARPWLLAMQNRRRRLGRLRQGLRQRGPDLHPVRRPQRDDRPELRGHHRPRARGAPRLGVRPDHPAVRRAAAFLEREAAAGRNLVRALGLQLHLRHRGSRCAGSCTPARTCARRRVPADRRVDPRAPERRRRLGRAAALLRRSRRPRARGRRRPSQTAWALDGPLRHGRPRLRVPCAAASTTC